MMKTSSHSDATGTTVDVYFPYGVGMFIALECFRETNNNDCLKQLQKASENTKQNSCGGVSICLS